jgi:hypothetical protein
MTKTSETAADALLAPFEARAPTTDAKEAERRREGLRLGTELNRLQGATRCKLDPRFDDLFVTGRISKEESLTLLLALVRQGLLNG